jgi:WD40 repeat protein
MLFGMCFAPDGGRVLTGCQDGQAPLWDWQSGHLVCSPGRHNFEICAVAFNPDGRWGLVGGRDPALGTRTAQAWKFITGKPVTPPLGA